ncbi:hypothetical protein [Streptomyces roseolus]|uniref:hypothetical protein n=1 Tax=Streptomyces roseolus TaxID=67358 RepID=UPI003799DFFA
MGFVFLLLPGVPGAGAERAPPAGVADPERLARARVVASGPAWGSTANWTRCPGRLPDRAGVGDRRATPCGRRDRALLAVARGPTDTETADALHIGRSTVKTHLAGLTTERRARDRVEIAM